MATHTPGNNNPENKPGFQHAHRPNQEGAPENPGNQPGPQPQPGPGPRRKMGQDPNQQMPPRGNRGVRGVTTLDRQMRRPVSRRTTAEVVTRFRDTLAKALEEQTNQGFSSDPFDLIIIDNGQLQIGAISAILLTFMVEHKGQNYMAVFTMLVEGSADHLSPQQFNLNGQTIEIDTVPGDIFTDYYWERIQEHIHSIVGTDVIVEDAGVMTLPRSLEPEDGQRMHQILFNATQAVYTVMENNLESEEALFNVGMIDPNQERLTARMMFADRDQPDTGLSETATGAPVRSDVRISLEAVTDGFNQPGVPSQNQNQPKPLTYADVYMDLAYFPPSVYLMQQGMAANTMLAQQVTHHYFPRAIITQLDTYTDAITMELQLMALAQVPILSMNRSWTEPFRPAHHPESERGVNYRNIGALNLETNFSGRQDAKPQMIDVYRSDFNFNDFMAMAVHDQVVYAMDIEETGELSWIHHAFIDAASGNQEAYDLIIQAADSLTMGHFTQHFQGGPVTIPTSGRTQLGHYYDPKTGTYRDIRDLDELAILNAGGTKDPDLIKKWRETWYDTTIPEVVRLRDRKFIMNNLLTRVQITGYAQRVQFTRNFMSALTQSLYSAGIKIQPRNMVMENQSGGVRADMMAYNAGMSPEFMGGLFTQPQMYAGYNANNHAFRGRYYR